MKYQTHTVNMKLLLHTQKCQTDQKLIIKLLALAVAIPWIFFVLLFQNNNWLRKKEE